MRFAAMSLALCAAATAIPLDTSKVTGLVDTDPIEKKVGTLGVRSAIPLDTSKVTGLVDTDPIEKKVGTVGVRSELPDTSSVTGLADTSIVTEELSGLGVREIINDVTSDDGSDPLISILGAAPIATRNIVTNGGFPTQASSDSGLLEDLILEVRHIRFAIVKGIKDELKDIDPSLGREVSQIINELNRTERQLFKDVDLPGNIYHKLMIVIGEVNHVVKTIEGLLIGETTIIDPSVGSLIAQLSGDINSLSSNIDKIAGISPVSS